MVYINFSAMCLVVALDLLFTAVVLSIDFFWYVGRAKGLAFCLWSESDKDLSFLFLIWLGGGGDKHVENFLKRL